MRSDCVVDIYIVADVAKGVDASSKVNPDFNVLFPFCLALSGKNGAQRAYANTASICRAKNMDAVVATASDNDRSGTEGKYVVEPGLEAETREADGEQRGNAERTGDMSTAVGFGISGTGEGKVVLGRVGQRDDKELRYLHLLWEPGRAEMGAGGVATTLGKMMGSRARRHARAARSLGPMGKDIYGKTQIGFPHSCDQIITLCM